jgi:hypothetical protein
MKDSFVHNNNKIKVIFLKFNQKYEIFIQIKIEERKYMGFSIYSTNMKI